MTSIAVAIVNYNTRDELRACLASVSVQSPCEVVVVDNASRDGSVEMVRTEYPRVVLYASKNNVGYGAAANLAVASCKADYVLLLNADTRLATGALEGLKRYLDQHPEAAVVGPRLVRPDGKQQVSCHPFPTPFYTLLEITCLSRIIGYLPVLRNYYLCTWAHDRSRIVPWVGGAALAIRRKAFNDVGGFDESFFMYSEEVDLCYRLKAAGRQVHFAPVATVAHVGGASTAQDRVEMNVELFASIVQFYRRHYSKARLAALVVILKGVMLVRWTRDIFHFYATQDAEKRGRITEDLSTWKRVLTGDWPRRSRIVELTSSK